MRAHLISQEQLGKWRKPETMEVTRLVNMGVLEQVETLPRGAVEGQSCCKPSMF